ncbi:MAG TPA: glycosyltransferase family 39 protein [Candidatus Omnitrophota bacterium]|nr:glycosyltransferase family 39 protein [Candidatus Omnitrophota bacterium]
MKKLNWALIAILLLAAFLYFFQLGTPSVWDNDEGQLMGSSLEMLRSGEFLTPHLNSAIYFHKPPVFAWLTALVFQLFGVTEFWGRFWFAVFGIAGVGLTYLFAKELHNERAGLLSALIVATSPLYVVLSKMALVDIGLTFFITLSLYFFLRGYKAPADKKWFFLMSLAMAFGTMTKGPLGILVPGLAIGLFLLIDKKLPFLMEMVPLKGSLLYLLVASPWFIVETAREGPYFLKVIFGQFLFSIYMSPMQQHPGPFYYYIFVIILGLIPWSGLFVPALFRKPHALPLSLFLVMLAIFSTASTKVPGYFLPAFPAMAVITGAFLDRIFKGEHKLDYYLGLIFPVLFLSLAVWGFSITKIPAEYAQAAVYLETLMLIALAGFFLAFLCSFIKAQPWWTIGAWTAAIVVFFIGLIGWLLPYAEDFKYTRDLSLAMAGRDHVCYYKTWLPPSLVFYLDRQKYPAAVKEVYDEKQLAEFMRQPRSACYTSADEEKKIQLRHRVVSSKAGFAVVSL